VIELLENNKVKCGDDKKFGTWKVQDNDIHINYKANKCLYIFSEGSAG
jgi:hypothetical protein